jgi:hypothetical protein
MEPVTEKIWQDYNAGKIILDEAAEGLGSRRSRVRKNAKPPRARRPGGIEVDDEAQRRAADEGELPSWRIGGTCRTNWARRRR